MISALVLAALASIAPAFEARDLPDRFIVEAIIEHETRGDAHLCRNEHDGSSSRGLMQINRKHSRCCPEDDAKYAHDYDPARNVHHGVWLLAFQARWHREKDHCCHDPISHYAGTGPLARRFAREVREIAKRLREANT